MRDTNGSWRGVAVGIISVGAIVALGIFHPVLIGLAVAALLAALLAPPALLALLLRVVQFRDRHAYFRLVRPSSPQAFPPAAFGNSSGGRNVS